MNLQNLCKKLRLTIVLLTKFPELFLQNLEHALERANARSRIFQKSDVHHSIGTGARYVDLTLPAL
jgi:hypothetical protein